MKSIEKFYHRQPLISSLILVFISVSLMHSVKIFDQLSPFMLEFTTSIVRLLISFIIFVFLMKSGIGKDALITTPYKSWGKRWYVLISPISIIALINFLGVDFDSLNYSLNNVSLWIFSNVSIGLVEEIMMRGAVFYILYKAWGAVKKAYFPQL